MPDVNSSAKYARGLSYTMVHAHVRCDNALSHVHAQNHGITDLSHFHACRSSTSRDISWSMHVGNLGCYVINS